MTRPPTKRFIPARAGNRERQYPQDLQGSVHPRSCGEQEYSAPYAWGQYGSSPLVRGTGLWHYASFLGLRFIPARAGNRTSSSVRGNGIPVHPRSCGEQFCSAFDISPATGSSPLVRGTDELTVAIDELLRFIPARAGNSSYLVS